MKTKVFHIVRAATGGIRQHVVLLADGLPKDRFECRIVTSIDASDANFRNRLNEADFASMVIDMPIKENPSPSDLRILWRLAKHCFRERPDILHGHGAKGGLYARILAPLVGAKAVYSPHGGSLHRVFSRLKTCLFMAVEKCLCATTSALIFESDYSRSRYFQSVARVEKKSYLVPNGIPIHAAVDSGETNPKTSTPVKVGAFGSLRYIKGQDLLIEAARLLVDRGHSIEVRIFGEGPDHARLETLIRSLHLSNQVLLRGDVPNPIEEMEKCDLVAQPSRFESFGYVAIEAMELQKPVVAMAVGGLREVITDHVDGLLVQNRSAVAFADALESLLKNPELRTKLGSAGRAKVIERYSAGKMVFEIEQIYHSLVRSTVD